MYPHTKDSNNIFITSDIFMKDPSNSFSIIPENGSSNLELVSTTSTNHLVQLDTQTKFDTSRDNYAIYRFLRDTTHFHVLPQHVLYCLSEIVLQREYGPSECIISEGEFFQHLYVVVHGTVDLYILLETQDWKRETSTVGFQSGSFLESQSVSHFHSRDGMSRHLAALHTGDIFGLDGVIFKEPSPYTFLAGGSPSVPPNRTIIALIPKRVFRNLLHSNIPISQSVGRKLAEDMDIFSCFREFCLKVFSHDAIKDEYLPIRGILESYLKIQNVIHIKQHSHELDTAAWQYAIRRLPEDVTSTFCFDLVRALPPFLAFRMRELARQVDQKGIIPYQERYNDVLFIRTQDRRRCSWKMGMSGKTLVLLRDGFTDILDFVTNLCIHITESHKLRGLLQGMAQPPAVDLLDAFLVNKDSYSPEQQLIETKRILGKISLSQAEHSGLMKIWPTNCLQRIYEIIMHREEYILRVDSSVSRNFQMDPFHEWGLILRSQILEKCCLPSQAPLPKDLVIDIISSNTHCSKNMFSTFIRKHRENIKAFATSSDSLGSADLWHHEEDMIYAAMPGYLQLHPELVEEYQESLKQANVTVMHDTAMTGLQADIIPVWSINHNMIDPVLAENLRSIPSSNFSCSPQSCSHFSSKSTQIDSSCEAKSDVAYKKAHNSIPKATKPEPEAVKHVPLPNKNSSMLNRYDYNFSSIREEMSSCSKKHRHIIINMDFAFGAQAEGIMRTLISTFGSRIRSINIMGKAGGLVGSRGDIQLASGVLLSKSSLIYEDPQDELRVVNKPNIGIEQLQRFAGPKIQIHEGPVLTVPGTMMQNERLLRYYAMLWRCVGVEMEGSYFARAIQELRSAGVMNPDLVTNFIYYTSDLPLSSLKFRDGSGSWLFEKNTSLYPSHGSQEATLSASLKPWEGVPPLYAIARSIMETILA